MTKSDLTSAINSFISPVISVTKHRNSMLQIINFLFQTTVSQSLESGTNNFWYNLKFKKIGNIVHVDGYIKNTYAIAKSNITLLTISESELAVKTSSNPKIIAFAAGYTNTFLVTFEGSEIKLTGGTAIPSGVTIYINAHYQTND